MGHRCQGLKLMVLEGPNYDGDASLVLEPEEEEHEITLHALTGWTGPKAMRIEAMMGSHKMIALIDSGATHNFVSDRVASIMNMAINPTKPFTVRVANGDQLWCKGKYKQGAVRLQGIPFLLDFFPIPLHGIDLVLGIQWLETLGPVNCDWKDLTMKFMWDQKLRCLQGLRAPPIQGMSADCMVKETRQQQFIFALFVQEQLGLRKIQPEMESLLRQFREVFQEPTELPPSREIEHTISLKGGTDAVNVRPYRYAHFQKDEIERQVQAMLSSGLIRSSTSPFSSPVLLVKKKMDLGVFALIIEPLIWSLSKTGFQFPLWKIC